MKFNSETLAEALAQNIPHCTAADFLSIKEDSAEARDAISKAEEYFKAFAKRSPEEGCVICGKRQGGGMIEAILGTAYFKWGLAYGEGFCSNCGYPGRAHHDIPGVGKIQNMILQYHPDGLSFRKDKQEVEA